NGAQRTNPAHKAADENAKKKMELDGNHKKRILNTKIVRRIELRTEE
ncbi:6992_t:CDS:1, partial [Gigaspora margarita]